MPRITSEYRGGYRLSPSERNATALEEFRKEDIQVRAGLFIAKFLEKHPDKVFTIKMLKHEALDSQWGLLPPERSAKVVEYLYLIEEI